MFHGAAKWLLLFPRLRVFEEVGEEELLDILTVLERHGIKQRYTFTKVVSAKKLYHFDSLERLEKTVI